MPKLPSVSIIITTRNEAAHIENLLMSLKHQTYNNIETLVIDNNSKDETKIISQKYTPLVFDKGPERSAQRNFGAMKSKGDILIFLDADMELSPSVVAHCVEKLQQEHIQSVIIPEKSIGKGFWSQCKAFERSFYLGVDWIESARCFRRSVFVILGGFDETMSGPEDFDFSQRLINEYGKIAVARIQSFIFHNEGTIELFELWRRKFYYGKSLKHYFEKKHNKTFNNKQGNILYRYGIFFTHPLKLLRHPLLTVGMLLMKTGELVALEAGSLVG